MESQTNAVLFILSKQFFADPVVGSRMKTTLVICSFGKRDKSQKNTIQYTASFPTGLEFPRIPKGGWLILTSLYRAVSFSIQLFLMCILITSLSRAKACPRAHDKLNIINGVLRLDKINSH